jgi:hypothetical protein
MVVVQKKEECGETGFSTVSNQQNPQLRRAVELRVHRMLDGGIFDTVNLKLDPIYSTIILIDACPTRESCLPSTSE